jgi:hypothetical protein
VAIRALGWTDPGIGLWLPPDTGMLMRLGRLFWLAAEADGTPIANPMDKTADETRNRGRVMQGMEISCVPNGLGQESVTPQSTARVAGISF